MKSHHVDLLNEAIAPALTRLALPIMATSLVQMLYNLTDMAWIGRLGAGAVTAVGSAGMYTWFSQGFAILARTGGQVKTAHCLGAGENDSAAQYARGALQLGILFAVLYGLVSLFGASRLIGFFKLNSPEVIAQAEWYVRIACGLVIFSYLNAILTGLLTAAGNSRTPFIVNVAGLVFNVVLDPVLIFGIGPFPELGVSGAAAATVTAQALVSLLFFKAVLREKVLFPHLRLWVLVPVKVWREIVRIGVPSAVQNLIYAGISMILTRLITGWGDLAVAAQRVGSQIESVSWMVGDGFSAAVNAFLGQNYGAKRYDRVLESFWFCVKVSAVFLMTLAVVSFIGAPQIMRVFRKEDLDVIEIGTWAMRFQCLTLPLSAWIIMSNMLTQTIGYGFRASFVAAGRQGLFLIPALFVLPVRFGIRGLQWCQPVADALTFVLGAVIILGILKELKGKAAEADKEPRNVA